MPDFQPELVDLILKHIITIDTPLDEVTLTLLRCCLVSRTWRAFAQPYLFSEVLRRSPARDLSNLSDRLCETLSRYEHLKDYITSLSVDAGGLSDPSRKRLFDLIPHVHELVLVADSSPQALPDRDFAELWAEINPSSRLTTLCINTVSDFPIEIFYHMSALQRLHLIDAGFSGFDDSDGSLESGSGPVQTKKPKLSDLYVFCRLDHMDINVLAWFLNPECAFHLSELSTCHIIYIAGFRETEGHLIVERFLRSISTPTIRDIGFAPPLFLAEEKKDYHLPQYQVFHNLPNVRSVKIVLEKTILGEQNPIQWVASQFLPQIPRPDRLVELLLIYDGDPAFNSSQIIPKWSSLAALLSPESTSFCNLQELHLVHYCPNTDRYAYTLNTLKQIIRISFPRLHEQRILRVSLSPVEGYMSRSERRYEWPYT